MYRTAVAALLIAAASATAHAQFVTKPPASAPKIDADIPKPPPPPPMSEPIQVNTAPKAKPAPPEVLPDLPLREPLIVRDDAGALRPLKDPIDLAALRVNPHITPETLEKILPIAASRKDTFEKLVVANLDLVEQIEGGAFEKANLEAKDAMKKLLDMSNPLRHPAAPKRLPDVLQDQGVITRAQAAYNAKIANDYSRASVPAGSGAELAKRSLVAMYKQSVDEPLFAYRALCVETTARLEAALAKTTLDQSVKATLMAAGKKVGANATDAQRLEAYKAMTAGLSVEQRRQLLNGTIDSRAK